MTSRTHHELAVKASELLGDGEWHSYEQVMTRLMKVIQPSEGIRQNEKDRALSAKGRRRRDGSTWTPPTERVYESSTEDRIRSGRRSIVRQFLSNKAFETDRPGTPRKGSGYGRQIRMVGRLRATHADPIRVKRDQLLEDNEALRQENERLRNATKKMYDFLRNAGFPSVAEELMEETTG